MKKLKLELDELRVNSFETAADRPAAQGTVRAHSVYSEAVVLRPMDGTDGGGDTFYTHCCGWPSAQSCGSCLPGLTW